jgi:hypothetical protein
MNNSSIFSPNQFRALKRFLENCIHDAATQAIDRALHARTPRFIYVGNWVVSIDNVARVLPEDSDKPNGSWIIGFKDSSDNWRISASDAKLVRHQLERSRF